MTQRRPPAVRGMMTGGLVVAGILVAMLVMAIFVNQLSASWFMYVMGAVMVGPLLISARHPRRLLLALTVVCIQINANIYLLQRDDSSSVGTSGPGGIRFSLCALLAISLLVLELARHDTDAKRVEIPPMFKRPLMYYMGAILLSGLATPERMLLVFYVHQQILCVIMLVAVANAIRDQHDLDMVVKCLLISLIVQSALYFLEAALGVTFNPEGHAYQVSDAKDHGGTFFSHSNGLAGYLLPLVILALTQFFRKRGETARRLSTIALAVGAAGVIATMARAAWVGCAIGGAFVVYVGRKRKLIPANRVGLLVAGGVVVALLFAGSLADRASANHSRDYEERKALMKMAWNVYVAHPVIGCGAGAYAQVFKRYLSNDQLNQWLYVVHNRFLLTAAEMGTIGFLAFVSMLWAWFQSGWKLLDSASDSSRMIGLGMCGAVVGMGWHMYWEPLTGFPIDGLIYGLMGIAAAAVRVDAQAALAPEVSAEAPTVARGAWPEPMPGVGRSGR